MRRGGPWTRPARTRCWSCMPLTGDSHAAGPAGPGHPTPGGGTALIGPGCRHRHRPLVRGLPQRARRLPGDDRPVVAVARRHARGVAVPRDHHPRPGGGRGRCSPTTWASTGGPAWSAARWAGCGCSSGASGTPNGWRRAAVLAVGAAATAEQIALCSVQCRAIRLDPAFAGGDYYDAGPAPARRAWRSPGVSARSATGPPAEFDQRFGRDPRATRTRSTGGRFAVESYLDYQGDKLADRFDPNSYLVLSEAMNRHDVGRGRGGVTAALAGVTAEVAVAGIDSDRLYPRPAGRVGRALPEAGPPTVIASAVRARRLPARSRTRSPPWCPPP